MAYFFTLPFIVIFVCFPSVILRIYTDSPELINASVPALWVLCSSYIFMVPGGVLFQAVSGTGNTRAALLLELATLTIYVIYVVYMIFYLRIDVAWCWTTEHVYGGCIMVLSYIYLKKGKWQGRKI